MKVFFLLFATVFISNICNAQIPKSGTYTFSYCDLEYDTCLNKCKVVIKGNYIIVYAPDGLTGIKKGEVFEKGKLVKRKQNMWFIIHQSEHKPSKKNGAESWINFKTKQYWTF